MRTGKKIFIMSLIVFILLAIFIISSLSGLIIDYQWFKELGYTRVFFIRFVTELKIGIPLFVLVFLIILTYLYKVKYDFVKFSTDYNISNDIKGYNLAIWIVSFIVAFITSLSLANNLWSQALSFFNSVNFNINDPIFGRDISLYMFKLPFLRGILGFVTTLLIILTIITVVLYGIMYLSDSTRFYKLSDNNVLKAYSNREIIKLLAARVGVFGLLLFILFGVFYYLKAFNLVYSTRGVVFGASYTDIHVTLLSYRILIVLSIISGILFFIGAIKKNLKLVTIGPVTIVSVILLFSIISGLFQQMVVSPNELTKELPYIKYNIDYTQKGFGLDKVKQIQFNYKENLTAQSIEKNQVTINNIRLNDYRPVNQVYNQLQGIRLYYKFNDVDIDRYNIGGKYTQTFLSARELSTPNLTDQAKTWINEHLKYTHGYGVVMSPVNTINSQGQPVLDIKNIPPVSKYSELKITRPEIYFGELTNDYVITNTDLKEFDYPSGADNVESTYKGTAGIQMNFLNRILFTVNTADLKILLSNDINSHSKMLIYRNIMERVKKIAPFLTYDQDPYIVINNGKLYWIIDAFTTSNSYPYSQPYQLFDGRYINYIRNSVKVVVDAYNGAVNYYIIDKNDPVAMVYKNIFPELFKDISQMPDGLRKHIRYPQDLFDLQAEVYRNYHMNNPTVFYNREDTYDIAKEKYYGKTQPEESQYIITKLPDMSGEEYVLTIPYVPAQKDNLVGYLVGRMDGQNYGQLILYTMPKGMTIYGPMQIEAKIDNSPEISKELSLWGQKGSQVMRGNTLVIPIDNSLIYVEPLYIKSDAKESIPEVKRVILAYNNQIVMENTLSDALNKIFNIQPAQAVPTKTGVQITNKNAIDLINQANDLYTKADNAIKIGNWADYGKYIKQLGDVLSRLRTTIK